MWLKPAMARPVIAMLLLVLVVAASSCERERQPEKPSKDRPPQLKLENAFTLTIVPLVDGGV
jgi:hypothetical protein